MQSNIFERTLHVMQNKCALIIETLENKHEPKKKIKVTQIYMRYILPKQSLNILVQHHL